MKQSIGLLATALVLTACGQREVPLVGERIDVREAALAGSIDAEAVVTETSRPISLAAAQANAEWPQKNGSASHTIAHPALSGGLTRIWSANIGAGNGKKHSLTADPVVAGGRVFTLDARSGLRAFTTDGGALWETDLTPASEKNQDASGGGLAFDAGVIYATTGFGELNAVDAATGEVIWVQDTLASVSGAPTVQDGIVYVVGRDNRAWAVRAEDGRVLWQVSGAPSAAGLVGAASPAISDRLAIFPMGTSELVATLRKSGVRVWASSVAGQRRGKVYGAIDDLTGDPVIDGNVIYAANQSGQTVAVSASSGQRIWTVEEGAYSPLWPAGDSVFMVTDQAELIRLDAETGDKIWGVNLPLFTKEKVKRRKAVYPHYGPIVAGGRVIVGSGDGVLRSFDPVDGSLLGEIDIPSGAASNPVVAGQTLYIVSAKGQLHAFR
ncbi:outer membrane protein assembly factor BamB family protein [Actibacterium pelagium]|uniref:outer membrane protein assembly factor BamB family protein n=1 Tax=Actibacterium pelagium TaxID=2029103 RepID=UPI001E38C1FE|nr:PQQ-like beta-propeller repeat protein [Actibacterium pelagium]